MKYFLILILLAMTYGCVTLPQQQSLKEYPKYPTNEERYQYIILINQSTTFWGF